MEPALVIVGRPNVGKSTLFNRLVGRRLALVDDTPGVTRDRREGEGRLGELAFRVIDTAGLEEAFDETLGARARRQTERALADAAVVLMVVDARAGVTPLDEHFADWLRRSGKPVVLVANKFEGVAAEPGLYEAHALGLGEPVRLSAAQGIGLALLREVVEVRLRGRGTADAAGEVEGDVDLKPLKLAIVGRPNVGKSTLVNALIGSERLLTGPEPGITRDAIPVAWTFGGRQVELVDTAGLRRKARIDQKLEKLSGADSLRAIRFAEVVAVVIDAAVMMERQDLSIARHVIEEGRALVIVANKWDLVRDRAGALRRLTDRLGTSLPQATGVKVVTLSATTGRGLNAFMPAVLAAYDVWNRRVPTGALNNWLAGMVARHPPPVSAVGRRVRLRYMTQPNARPPTFVIFASRPGDLPPSYLRYLENGLRAEFALPGTPIRILMRKGENPYA